MKKVIIIFAIAISFCINVFSQATSLTVDCQNPGWLSSKIAYGDQQTLKNLKVTGYINATDLEFIKDMNINHVLRGVIDLEDVQIAKGGDIMNDNSLFTSLPIFRLTKTIQKFVYPKALVSGPLLPFDASNSEKVDSVIWTSKNINYLDIQNGVCGNCNFVYLPEIVERISTIPSDLRIVFPSTIKIVDGVPSSNLTIYSYITNPEAVKCQFETYDSSNGHGYWNAIKNSKFYIPKGSKEKYMNSEFATMDSYRYENGNYTRINNGNKFIEVYDVDCTKVIPNMILYKGESASLDVEIYPDANLVSWINYSSTSPEIVSIDSEGIIIAKEYGKAEVSATPHVFFEGLETKTGTCVVNVLAHVEGIDLPATMTLHIGEQKAINAKTLPLDITDNQLSYISSNSSIATVTGDGFVVGHKRGTCTITATSIDGGYTAECVVTVLQPVEAVTLNKHFVGIRVGKTETLTAIVLPTAAENKNIIWTSSDETIARVDDQGVVTGINDGVVWITATSEDNNEAFDKCEVVVSQSDFYVVSISTNNISTYCNPFPLDVSSITNLKAYIASGFDSSTGLVLLTRVYKVPAGEGILLKGDAGDYEVPYAETNMYYTNLLKGVTRATTISPTEGNYTNFILANGSHGIGFYTLSQAGEIAAGKAYLQLPTPAISNGARGIKMRFDDEDSNPTAVSEVENQQPSESEYYDLQGRKVRSGAKMKGMYIMRNANGGNQGKKVFFRR